MEVLSVAGVVHHGSHPGVQGGQPPRAKPRGQQAVLDGPANPQAATRVNPEQASKVKSWTPTRLNHGEGRRAPGKKPLSAPGAVHRGNGSGMRGRVYTQRGRPGRAWGRSPQRTFGVRSNRDSEGPELPLKPGNAGGGIPRCQGSCRLNPPSRPTSLRGAAARSLPLAG
jgi:hypothetical protein